MSDKQEAIFCRICRKNQLTVQGRCRSCGTPAANAKSNSKPGSGLTKCPFCHHGSTVQLEEGRFYCKICDKHFEDDDFGFLDTRPDVNLEKKERNEAKKKARRRRR